ncbi:origin of replication complex subunit 3 [Rhodamnia argentea]|uniref:Origin of replication complex subunit 3 n=1 Tax=Rhodamnia argentea TaxID=178133 RepID=A0A8B8PG17_9MYRT|nr:origin of replication complex subunit 3 [Rhodamnia argentea]
MKMAASAPSRVEPSSDQENGDNSLQIQQPFFLLHKAAPDKSDRKPSRRRITSSPPSPNKPGAAKSVDDDYSGDHSHEHLRMEAFQHAWSDVEATIEGVLRSIDSGTFEAIYSWISESFSIIRTHVSSGFSEISRSFPAAVESVSRRLFTGLVLTKNMELFDDLRTFEELGRFLRSHGCHVANLSSLDFLAKNGIGGCITSLLRQFLAASVDAPDMLTLSSWYNDQVNNDTPIILIIDDLERCCGSVLSDFILLLSEWVMKIPVVLIIGVATTPDRLRSIIQSEALQCLCPFKFNLGTLAERMDAVVEAILVKQCPGFFISHKVAVFMRNHFANHGGTMSSFIRALKIACVQHFSMEPFSFVLRGLIEEDIQRSKQGLLPKAIYNCASNISPCDRNKMDEEAVQKLVPEIIQLKRLHFLWSIVVLCLYEAGKYDKLHLLDLLCEALDPEVYASRVPGSFTQETRHTKASSPNDCFTHQHNFTMRKGGFISRAMRKVRDLAESHLLSLLKKWERHTADISEIHEKVKELQHMLKFEDCQQLKKDSMEIAKIHGLQSKSNLGRVTKRVNDKAASFLAYLIEKYMQPIECVPFHEIVCFKNVKKLQMALVGDSRRRIQVDLLESHKILSCSCCRNNNILLPSMHDTSIMYSSCQEHGDLVNLHDWYHSFKRILLFPNSKRRHKLKQSPLSKKQKFTDDSEKLSEVAIQSRFCRGVTELQIAGLLRMQSKRRPDFVQRVAFGL